MNKASFYLPASLALVCGAAWGVYLMATAPQEFSRFRPGETRQMKLVHQSKDAGSVGNGAKFTPSENVELDHSQSPPKVMVLEPVHNFGAMDPFSTAEHTFTIRNEGTSTLTLQAGPTTCKCTACVVKQPRVAPGAEAQIDVAWRTVGRQQHFRHSATVYTNDPTNPAIKLVIEGAVHAHLGVEPPDFTLPRVHPQSPTVARTVLYSQAWESFSLDNFSSTMAGVTFKTYPATESELKPFGAKAGYVLEVTLPAGLPSGNFNESIRFDVRHDETTAEKPLEFGIGLEGKVLNRLSVKGDGIDSDGRIQLDPINPLKGRRQRLLIKVNDPEMELPVERIACTPDFVSVQVTPYLPEGKQVGLYYLDIFIPPNVPPAAHLGNNPGAIEIDFDHPRVEDLRLKLEFIISSPE